MTKILVVEDESDIRELLVDILCDSGYDVVEAGDGGAALDAGLDRPHGCGIDRRGNIYIADGINHRVRVVGVAS